MVPDREASCSLVESCPVEPVREFRRQHPEYAIVSYINTSIEVKAESDILCTSRNAVKIVNSIPAEQPVLFLPDSNLGNYVKQADRAREHEDLAGHLHRACHVPGAAAGGGEGGASAAPWWWRIRSARNRCWRWRISSGRLRRSSSGAWRSDAQRVHRDDGERRESFAAETGAGEAVLLRGQRELQLQRVPVHEAQHAGETARLPAQSGAARGVVRGRDAAGAGCRWSACSR